jgi:hypothetical protein
MSDTEMEPPLKPHLPSQGPPKEQPPPYAQKGEPEPVRIEIEFVPLHGEEGRTLRAAQASVIHEILCWFAARDAHEESNERVGDGSRTGPV